MSTIEIKLKKINLIIYLGLILAIIGGSLYFLFLTDIFLELITKFAGTVGNIALLYLVWVILNKLRENRTELLITPEMIGFYKQNDWNEVSFSSLQSYNFKKFYDGSKWIKQLVLELTTGEQKIIELNGLDTNQAKLELILKERKSW